MEFNIYADIASFFDFRYAAMVKHSKEMSYSVAELFKEYTSRDHDDLYLLFPNLPKKLDTTPSKELLPYALITDVDDLIRQDILSYINRPDIEVKKVILTVDFQGIILTEKENELFKVLISSRFDHGIEVRLISQSHINLLKFNTRYDLAIVYDVNDRIVKPMVKPKLRLTHCNVQTPFRLLSGTVEAGRRFIEAAKALPYDNSPDELLKEQMLAMMPLHFVEMKYFCIKQL